MGGTARCNEKDCGAALHDGIGGMIHNQAQDSDEDLVMPRSQVDLPSLCFRLLRRLLWPLSRLYGLVISIRNHAYDIGILPTFSSRLPVVCVGNLTAGGSGKTPLVLALANELLVQGHRPVILSRGYGGRFVGPHRVSVADRADEVGDEPLLMARRGICPVVVARDRVAGARCIESSIDASVILLDDGLQHRRLARVCNIVTFFVGTDAAVDSIIEGALLPFGRFREDRDGGLRRAHIVGLCDRGGRCSAARTEQVRGLIPADIPVFSIGASITKPTQQGAVLEDGRAVWLFCAIANPEGFVESVRSAGYAVAGVSYFPDHHRFCGEDLEELEQHAELQGAALVCTEKDWVKLPNRLQNGVWVVYLQVKIPFGVIEVVKRLVDGA